MSVNVGDIDLGLNINRDGFNRQLNGLASGAQSGIQKAFLPLGKLIGGALAIGGLIAFGKSCTDLGSDLTEVQNVVDVTFGSMAGEINKFAATAITSFGLSETSAKKYASTMGAMLKSMQIPTKQALVMSKNITGLSADMASFYNLKSEEAFGKIRAGISGETEPLKQLGINMSVANMEAYAMGQGISKAYAKMSQSEQTLLRYNYLLSVTADAQGDFARTSGGWANQTRILSEQFNALKATLGQAFINLLTPVVTWLNILISKLQVVAAYFKAFTDAVFGAKGQKSGGGVGKKVADDIGGVGTAATDASSAIGGMGDATAGAAKKAKGALAGFDEINSLSLSQDEGSGGAGAGGGVDDIPEIDLGLGDMAQEADIFNKSLEKMKEEAARLAEIFKEGFKIGIGGDYQVKIDSIKTSFEGIKNSLKDIFTDNAVVSAFQGMIDSMAKSAGMIAGAYVSVGLTIAQNLLGGINKYLDQNKEFIKERLVGMFDATGKIAEMWARFAVVFADIFSVIGGETGQQITANIIGIFANAWLGIQELSLKFVADIMECFVKPFEDNKDSIKTAIENTLKPIETVTGTIKDFVTNTFAKILEAYEKYIQPAFDNISSGLSSLMETVLKVYNENIAPVLDEWSKKFEALYKEYIQPTVDSIIEFLGKLALAMSEVFEGLIIPVMKKVIEEWGPKLQLAFQIIGDIAEAAFKLILSSVKLAFDNLGLLIDFVKNVFKGDWEAAFSNVKQIFENTSKALGEKVTIIKDMFSNLITHIQTYVATKWGEAWNGIKTGFETFKTEINQKIADVKQKFSDIGTYISGAFKTAWNTAFGGMKSTFISTWDTMGDKVKTIVNNMIGFINKMINGINRISFNLPDVMGGGHVGFSIPEIPRLARGGIVDQPTLAMVGEAGKEAVVPLENNTAWMDKLSEIVTNALLSVTAGGGGGSSNDGRPIILNMNDREIARGILPELVREAKRLEVKFE